MRDGSKNTRISLFACADTGNRTPQPRPPPRHRASPHPWWFGRAAGWRCGYRISAMRLPHLDNANTRPLVLETNNAGCIIRDWGLFPVRALIHRTLCSRLQTAVAEPRVFSTTFEMECIMNDDGRSDLSLSPTVNSGYSAPATCNRFCPRCNSAVFSVSRCFVDLLLSVFLPIRRYRCISMQCSWEGNLRDERQPKGGGGNRQDRGASMAGGAHAHAGSATAIKVFFR